LWKAHPICLNPQIIFNNNFEHGYFYHNENISLKACLNLFLHCKKGVLKKNPPLIISTFANFWFWKFGLKRII
jgi:hypothetical protein